MSKTKTAIKFGDINQFADRDIAYQQNPALFKEFYNYSPDIDGFRQKIDNAKKHDIDRTLLQKVIKQQYKELILSPTLQQQIDKLADDNNYTIITAHQPGLFTGPLYYISKIASCIKLARRLNEAFPDNHIIPVFVHGGEDHDFEEVNHFYLYNNKIEWQNEGSGAVGRFSLDGLKEVQAHAEELLAREDKLADWKTIFDQAIEGAKSYAEFMHRLVHGLFGHTELLQLNMDNAELKRSFIPIIKKELIERPSQVLVKSTQNKIESLGHKAQAFPREINLFLHTDQGRKRIVYEDENYKILDTELSYSEEEILKLLEQSPEQFSPNVVIRPLYQEYCLPNLAYIGGGGELAYWLERKTQFEHFGLSLPVLMRRDSFLYLNKSILKNIDKLSLELTDFFPHIDEIINSYIAGASTINIDLSKEKSSIKKIYESLAYKAKEADPTLQKVTMAEYHKQIKAIDSIESRIKRSLKSKEEVTINKLRKVKESIFPGSSLQERKVNFLQFYARYGQSFLDELIDLADPLDPHVKIFNAEKLS